MDDSPLKNEIRLNYIHKFKPCLTASELDIQYKVKSVKLCGEISGPGCENFIEHVNSLTGQK